MNADVCLSTGDLASGRAYLALRALDQTFALPIEFARSVFKIEALTRVPLAPSHLVGLTNLRGGIIAIVCLARRLNPNVRPLGVGALAVAIEVGAETFGLAVQEIDDVIHARDEDLAPAPPHVDLPQAALMAGVLRLESTLVPIIDPLSVFDIRRGADTAQF